jgi:hypothetical protein
MVMLTMAILSVTVFADVGFDLLNYSYLWNDDAEKARMIINPASKKKEADDWKPPRKLKQNECTKMIEILTERFGPPARCRKGYASFVYVWRFEGKEWLSIGVSTVANMGGDAIAIHHWEWRTPEESIYTEEEMKESVYPVVKIEDEGLPPAAFFELFDPYSGFKDGETDNNLITEFNATKYLSLYYPRCTAEWDKDERRYDIWTKYPDERRGEFPYKGDGRGVHTNECSVGKVKFYKLAPNLFMCCSIFRVDGTLGADSARYLFEVYNRDIYSVDFENPIKSKMVRYLGTFSIDNVSKFREDWIRKNSSENKWHTKEQAVLFGTPYLSTPKNLKCLYKRETLSLFSGETVEDVAFNKASKIESRNSLFLRLHTKNGKSSWRLLMTSDGGWKDDDKMGKWDKDKAQMLRKCFLVDSANLSKDEKRIWLVCDPQIGTYRLVCSFDLEENVFRVLIDGDTADEQLDGTILIKNKKTYLNDENGESLGARWYDVWITPDGVIKRKGKLKTAEEVEAS